jgi:hypothetical protein
LRRISVEFGLISFKPKAPVRTETVQGPETCDDNVIPQNISARALIQAVLEGKVSEESAAAFLAKKLDSEPDSAAFVAEVLYGIARAEEGNGAFALGEGERKSSKALKILDLLSPEQRAVVVGYVMEHYGTRNNCRYDRLNKQRDFVSWVARIVMDLETDPQGNITNKDAFTDKWGQSIRKAFETAAYKCCLSAP